MSPILIGSAAAAGGGTTPTPMATTRPARMADPAMPAIPSFSLFMAVLRLSFASARCAMPWPSASVLFVAAESALRRASHPASLRPKPREHLRRELLEPPAAPAGQQREGDPVEVEGRDLAQPFDAGAAIARDRDRLDELPADDLLVLRAKREVVGVLVALLGAQELGPEPLPAGAGPASTPGRSRPGSSPTRVRRSPPGPRRRRRSW